MSDYPDNLREPVTNGLILGEIELRNYGWTPMNSSLQSRKVVSEMNKIKLFGNYSGTILQPNYKWSEWEHVPFVRIEGE